MSDHVYIALNILLLFGAYVAGLSLWRTYGRTRMPKVTVLRDDDWQALYVDGELKAEGHKVTPEMAALALGAEVAPYDDEQHAAFTRHLDRCGSAPATIEEIGARHNPRAKT